MSTSNLNTQSLADLSSFEPEAILAAMPGEHPRYGCLWLWVEKLRKQAASMWLN
jgi:hypothetical protein